MIVRETYLDLLEIQPIVLQSPYLNLSLSVTFTLHTLLMVYCVEFSYYRDRTLYLYITNVHQIGYHQLL